jgi:hypothetical protein
VTLEALRGDLGHFFPAEVLQLLQLAQATGRLELDRGGERAVIHLERGRPVHARTSGGNVRTGEILVHRGALEPASLERALAEQQARPDQRLGALLVAARAVTAEQAHDAVREVSRRILYGLLLWRDGTFRFVPGDAGPVEDVRLDLDLDRLILEGMRQADEAQVR